METKTSPHFDATFPSFLRKAPAPSPQARIRRRASGGTSRRMKKAGQNFFRRALLLSQI